MCSVIIRETPCSEKKYSLDSVRSVESVQKIRTKMKFYEAIIIDFFRAVIRCCLWCADKLLQRHPHRDNLKPICAARGHDGSDTVEND